MSDPANWYEWIKVSAFVFGLVFGGLAVGSPCWVWLRKQVLTAIAGWLATLGTVLISMSIWQSIEIEGPGLKLRIAELADAIDALVASAAVSGSVVSGASFAPFRRLAQALKSDPELAEAYEGYLAKLGDLQAASTQLKHLAAKKQVIEGLGLQTFGSELILPDLEDAEAPTTRD